MSLLQIALWLLPAVLLFWAVGAYNRLMQLRARVDQAFAPLEQQIRLRHELTALFIEQARPHVEHERELLDAVFEASRQTRVLVESARSRLKEADAIEALATAEQPLARAWGRFRAVAENYPELGANAALQEMGEQMATLEGHLAFARQTFNAMVLDYNEAIQQFPTRLLSRPFGFRAMALLQPHGQQDACGPV